MKSKSQSGVALVITLLMLSVITFLTIAFLALSKRDRASVSVTKDQRIAREMSEIALARAHSEIISRMMQTNADGVHELLNFDYMVSKNYIRKAGFIKKTTLDYENVNYDYYDGTTTPIASDLYKVQNIANLRYDPRPPVFITTNSSYRNNLDFRYWLDINRNGLFEDSGVIAVTNIVNGSLTTNGTGTQWLEGDPQWIGVLRYPDAGHSATNQFSGRYAYFVQPVGKTLDLNYIHNHLKYTKPTSIVLDYYGRYNGVASWELNLAATLGALNTNAYVPASLSGYNYNTNAGVNGGITFLDANAILTNRYFTGASVKMPLSSNNNEQIYYGVQDLLGTSGVTNLNRLLPYMTNGDTYDRYTMSRLLSTLGVDSTQDLVVDVGRGKNWSTDQTRNSVRSKVNLNYDNVFQITNVLNVANSKNSDPSAVNTNFWPSPLRFFTNAADVLLRNEFANMVSITNIPVYCSTNAYVQYNARIHRCLQLAANLYDASTNYAYPSVFRPQFRWVMTKTVTNVYIVGYTQVTNDFQSNVLSRGFRNFEGKAGTTNDNIAGVPFVVGVKKGFPNLNKILMTNEILTTRKLRFYKANPQSADPPTKTNQMYLFNLASSFGFQTWNPYTSNFIRQTRIIASNSVSGYFTNEIGSGRRFYTNGYYNFYYAGTANSYIPGHVWSTQSEYTNSYIVRNGRNQLMLPSSVAYGTTLTTNLYLQYSNHVLVPSGGDNSTYDSVTGLPVYDWRLGFTNHVVYAMIVSNQLVDFVNILVTTNFSLYESMIASNKVTYSPWYTNGATHADNSGPSRGVSNQIEIARGRIQDATLFDTSKVESRGDVEGLDTWWRGTDSTTKDQWRYSAYQAEITNRVVFYLQANDPLVHYTVDDLLAAQSGQNISPNLMTKSSRYDPWPKNIKNATSTDVRFFTNILVKDPWITKPDDWNFPTNHYTTVGEIGQVHRGTPWQTIYLKADPAPAANAVIWTNWVHQIVETNGAIVAPNYPTNDWALLDLFTVAPNDNASYGTLSVNQTNVAAWAAVFSGTVLPVSGGATKVFHPTNTEWILNGYSPYTYTNSINYVRTRKSGKVFHRSGEILEARTLTINSPFISAGYQADTNVTDRVLEALPQTSMAMLKVGEPRFIIWAYGQSLRPAPNGLYLGANNFGICTNYQITGESLVRMVCHVVETNGAPKIVVDNYNLP